MIINFDSFIYKVKYIFRPYPSKTKPPSTLKQTKTFAQALNNLCDIPSSQFPQPVLKGENFAIEIPEGENCAKQVRFA